MEAALDQLTVLIVEDDEQIAVLLQFIVEREGFRVLLARDGRAAQKLIDEIESIFIELAEIKYAFSPTPICASTHSHDFKSPSPRRALRLPRGKAWSGRQYP